MHRSPTTPRVPPARSVALAIGLGLAACGAKTGLDVPPRECVSPHPPPPACATLRIGSPQVISEGPEGVTSFDVAPFESGAIVVRRSTIAGADGWRVSAVDETGRINDLGSRPLLGATDDALRRGQGSITAGCRPVALFEERTDAAGLRARCAIVPLGLFPLRFSPHALESVTTGCHDLLDDASGLSFLEPGPPTRIVRVGRAGTLGETSTLAPAGPWLTIRPTRLPLSGGGWAIPYFASGGGVSVVTLDASSRPVGTARWGETSSPIGVASTGRRAVWEAANGPDEDPIRLETAPLLPDGRGAAPAARLPTDGYYFLSHGLDVVGTGDDTIVMFRGGRIGEPPRVHVGLLDGAGSLRGEWIPLDPADRARLVPTRAGALVISVLASRDPAPIEATPLACGP